jgi:6-pyruvoyltetrahydropterin/6-carboxytetrahydropterin synthase
VGNSPTRKGSGNRDSSPDATLAPSIPGTGVASLTRRVTFAAAHRYRRPEWDDARNAAVFGPSSRESYHGHSYVCHVTVSGSIDPSTGMVVDLACLDRILATEIIDRFDHRNINLDVPQFAEGRLIPTGENLARFIYERVQATLGMAAHVTEVRVSEDESLSSSYRAT